MKTLRILIRVDAVLLAFFGLMMAVSTVSMTVSIPRDMFRSVQEQPPQIFLGTTVVVLAVVLFVVSNFALMGHRRKLGTLLATGNLVIASVVIAAQPSDWWAHLIGWIPALVLLIMAAALAWASWRPLRPDDAAAELVALQIPDDIRQAMLRQVSEAAAQEERNRLARDLHDSIKQQIFTINVSTAAAQELWERDPERARGALADVRRSAKEAMVEMQALLHQLAPRALASAGLVEALREQCEALGYRTGAEVSLQLGEAIPDDRLPPGTQETLFRIAQEALSNVGRHARARNVRVELGLQGEAVVLAVTDDGQGFSPGAAASGMGLRNLRERAESLRGTLEIASAPGAGTTMKVSIPLTPLVLPDTAAIEKRLRSWFNETAFTVCLTALFLVTTSLETANYLGFVLTFFLLGLVACSQVFGAAYKLSGITPAIAARLRHAKDRLQVFRLFVAACWTLYLWSLTRGDDGNPWGPVWGAMALLCAALTALALTYFHRRSQRRISWPSWSTWTWTSLWKHWPILVVIALSVYLAFFWDPEQQLALGFKQLLCGLAMAAALVYLFSRQPRLEGAAQ